MWMPWSRRHGPCAYRVIVFYCLHVAALGRVRLAACAAGGKSRKDRPVLRKAGSRPAGRKLSIVVLLAACAAGGRWGPVRGCAPPRPPLHSPRTTPRGFPASIILRGLRVLCSGSFPPFGRVISLRAAQCHSPLSLCTKIQGHLHRPEQFYFEIAADKCIKATTKVQTIASPKQTGRQIPLKKQALLSLLLPRRRPIKQQLKAFHPEGRQPTVRRTSLPFLPSPRRRPKAQKLKTFHPAGRLPTTRRASLPFPFLPSLLPPCRASSPFTKDKTFFSTARRAPELTCSA